MAKQMAHKKPAKWNEHLTGQGRDIAAFTLIRKGKAFQSPLIPKSETGTVTGIVSPRSVNGGAPLREATRDSSIANRKAKAGRGLQSGLTDKNQQYAALNRDGMVYKRRIGSEGYRASFPNRWAPLAR